MAKNQIPDHFSEALRILNEFTADQQNFKAIEMAGQTMVDSLIHGGCIFSCGNGGSFCDAMHFAEEMTGKFRNDRAPLRAIAISDPSHITCVSNDFGFDHIFSRYIDAHGKNGDVLLAISTSGNSKNVILAAEAAKHKGMKVIALTGKDGGNLSRIAHTEIRAPYSEYADRVQEIHIKVIHALIDYIEQNL